MVLECSVSSFFGVVGSLPAGVLPCQVAFAGSRQLSLSPSFCSSVVSFFASAGCSFAVGCCRGVDSSFLAVLSACPSLAARSSFFHAFSSRSSCGLPVAFTACAPPRAALACRTRALASSCGLLAVFSPLPLGRGSSLAVRVASRSGVPVLVVSV